MRISPDTAGRRPGLIAVRTQMALAVLFVLPSCSTHEAVETANAPGQVLVSAASVVRLEARKLEAGIAFTGELVPNETVEVVARFDGDLEAMLVREGQSVRRGQKLAAYKAREVRGTWSAATAELQAAQASLVAAENAVRRAKRLLDAGAAAPADLETAEAQHKAAEASVQSAQAQLNIAEENAATLDVPSPIDGIVSKIHVHSGARTAVGDFLLQIVDTQTLELSATVASENLRYVQPGTPIEFHIDAFPGEVFTGQVDRLNPTAEEGTRQVRVYTRLPNPGGRLVGGLFAIGRVIHATKDQATTAPLASLRLEGTEQVVYRIRAGHAERVVVQTGLVDEIDGIVELLGAVAPGESLLSGVVPGLRPGAPVRILAATTPASGTTER